MMNPLPYFVLATVALPVALILLQIIPEVLDAAKVVWPDTADSLPAGLAVIVRYRVSLLLVPAIYFGLGLISIRIKVLTAPMAITVCACIGFLIFIFSALMLSTPIILHGGM
jgi:hypothetical protein